MGSLAPAGGIRDGWRGVTPAPYRDGMRPTVRVNHNLIAVESDHTVHVMVGLAAPEAPKDSERPPLKLALDIDRSGSMAGAKLATTTTTRKRGR